MGIRTGEEWNYDGEKRKEGQEGVRRKWKRMEKWGQGGKVVQMDMGGERE